MIYEIIPVNNYQGNNSSTQFDFDFYIENETQLCVYHFNSNNTKIKLTYGIDYSINELKNKNGSFITFPLQTSGYSILADNEKLSLELTLPISQEVEYNNSSSVNYEELEYSFDYLTRLIQILARKMDRCVKVEEISEVTPDGLINQINANVISSTQNAQLAQKWASLENSTVDGVEYSSKHYANLAQDNYENSCNVLDEINRKEKFQTRSIGEIVYSSIPLFQSVQRFSRS